MATARPYSTAEDRGTQLTVAVFTSYSETLVQQQQDDDLLVTTSHTAHNATAEMFNISMEGDIPSPPLSPQPREMHNIHELLNTMLYSDEHLTQEDKDFAKEAARRLRKMGDEMELTFEQHTLWAELRSAILSSDQGLQQQFRDCFQKFREQITTRTIVKVLHLSFKLLSCASTVSHQPEQTEVVENVIVFLIEQVTSWIQEQGGWDNWTEISSSEQQEEEQEEERVVFSSRSTPTLLQHNNTRAASTPPPECRRTNTELVRNWRSQSFSYPVPIGRRFTSTYPGTSGSFPRTRELLSDDSTSNNSSRRGSLSSLMTIVGASALTVALVSYLQS